MTDNRDLGQDLETRLSLMPNTINFAHPEYTDMIDKHLLRKFQNTGRAVSTFIKRDDIFVLCLLNLLLMYQEDYQDWFKSVNRLVMKKIKDCCVIDEGVRDVNCIYRDFCQDLFELAQVQTRVIQASQTIPN